MQEGVPPQLHGSHNGPVCASALRTQVKSLDLGSPFASKSNVVAYDRHVLFTSDDPTDATRHRAPGPISMTRIEEAFVHEMPEQLVGLVFAQADLVAYVCDLSVGVYLVPSALALVDSPEHRSALVVGKLCRHYAPLPLVPLPTLRLPGRSKLHSARDAARPGRTSLVPHFSLVLTGAKSQAEARRGVFSNSA